MTLMIEYKDGRKVQMTKIDTYGILGPILCGIQKNAINGEQTQVSGINLEEVRQYWVDGEGFILPLNY